MVRTGEVTGIPPTVPTSPFGKEARRRSRMSSGSRPWRRGTPTSIRPGRSSQTPYSAPALRWVRKAPSPQARIAAIHRPCLDSWALPTA
jgi:hypothetical protein